MNPRRHAAGFTLIELLVVLALMGLVGAMVLPNLQRVTGQLEYATQRDRLFADLSSLGYRAFVLGQGFTLREESAVQILADGNPILVLPQGWRLQVPKPVEFRFNGTCSGGQVSLINEDGARHDFRLSPVSCEVNVNAPGTP
ncbi:type II secretion system protein [Paucibacter sp. APW11]|uniref:Type II secretion system protein n=1 Tax=Roseateles aquae TaxID=3077235 RepID=A0ABU3PF71_9BURK|nr:type II secretion system protein [Paucibacter sp. APW11]MDT9001247.1 type II secretion system protein [Paucibacter sp. APW11]